MSRPVPYPVDTLAKGWRFELDLERVSQSDTWALATPDVRPWLLMLWATAWQQKPCGSMPADDALIAARLGMSIKTLAKYRVVLLRGWWLAEDGRLYQDTIVERVVEMLAKRDADRKRKADYRARKDSERTDKPSSSVPHLSHGTDTGNHQDSTGSDNTRTSTRTSIGIPTLVAKDKSSVCVDSAHTQIPDDFRAAIRTARPELDAELVYAAFFDHYEPSKRTLAKWNQWVKNERTGVAEAASVAKADPDTRPNVEARGVAAGVGKWDDTVEQWPQYKARVQAAERRAA